MGVIEESQNAWASPLLLDDVTWHLATTPTPGGGCPRVTEAGGAHCQPEEKCNRIQGGTVSGVLLGG